MFYFLILSAFVGSAGLALLCVIGVSSAGAAAVGRMSIDDAMILLHAAGGLGASVTAFWAPRSRFARFRQARNQGRVLGALLLAYGLIWAIHLVERNVDSSVHEPSALTLLIGLGVALAVLLVDIARSRAPGASAKL